MDKALLKYEMDRRNVSVDDLCKSIGISRSAFYRKIGGKTEFTRSEMQSIVDLLHLDSPVPIFFGKEVS